jgi:BirA family biotin operon repressor/biotin-[acetyl-CoA-carboxylase] ligase
MQLLFSPNFCSLFCLVISLRLFKIIILFSFNRIALSNFPIIELDSVDSTNNYAMYLIDANKAQPGLTIVAKSQVSGKGQRGKSWADEPGKSLLMSIVANPVHVIARQFEFNALVAVTIADVLKKLCDEWRLSIKWPNDIIINDKKAGGILIENILRGHKWLHSVIGFGLNVNQGNFPTDLPFATSLRIESGLEFDLGVLRDALIENIMEQTLNPFPPNNILEKYNDYLYKRGCMQGFSDGKEKWEALIIKAHIDGTLEVQREDGSVWRYNHGQVLWEWR